MARVLLLAAACIVTCVCGFQVVGGGGKPQVSIQTPPRLFPLFSAESSGKQQVEGLASWDTANWTPKRIWNTQLFRSSAILGALSLAFLRSPLQQISKQAAGMIHIMSFGTWFGTVVYTTFIAGITMYKNLPRQTFGKLQSKLFPQYFGLCSVSILLQILTSKRIGFEPLSAPLLVSLAMTCLNQFFLEPRSTEIMFARYDLENQKGGKETDEYKKLASSFGKFHGISSLTNLIALLGAIFHGVSISRALVV